MGVGIMAIDLEVMRKERTLRYLDSWSKRLGYCNRCDHEYYASEAIVINDEKSCPSCKVVEDVSYYYCQEHGTAVCQECK